MLQLDHVFYHISTIELLHETLSILRFPALSWWPWLYNFYGFEYLEIG